MRTFQPIEIIEVSYNSQGRPQSCFVSSVALARRAAGGCVSMHNADGTAILMKWPGDEEDSVALLNVKNIIVRGTPRLPDDWQATTQAAYVAFWKEFAAECGVAA